MSREWVTVPAEPTPEMVEEICRSHTTENVRTEAIQSAPAPAEVPIEEAPTLMKLIRAAWAGDRRIAEAYGTLLADRMDADDPGRGRYVRQMLEVLRGERPEVFVHAASSPAPSEVPMPVSEGTIAYEPQPYEPEWISSEPAYSESQLLAYAAAREAAERERVQMLMAERAELAPTELGKLPRRLLDVACRVRVHETLHRDDELIDQAAHAIVGALNASREATAVRDGRPRDGDEHGRFAP